MTTTKVNLANTVEGILPVANGGTGSSTGVSPGGSTTQVQFNNAGAFGGDSGFVYTGGNVGIGTSSPAVKLDIASATGITRVTSTTGTNAVYSYLVNTGGGFYIGRENSAGSSFGSSAYASVLYSEGNYPMAFFTNGSEKMRVTSDGNVGIGVSPSTKLDVSGIVTSRGSGNAARFSTVDTDGGGATILMNAAFSGAGTPAIQTQTNHPILFATNNTERMRIDSSGNVLIGTTTSTALSTGQLQIGTTSASDSAIQMLTSTTGTSGVYFGDGTTGDTRYRGAVEYANNGDSLRFYSASAERMRIDSSGNVGIGTSSPSYRLDVQNSANTAVRLQIRNTNSGSSANSYFTLGNDTGDSIAGLILGSSTNSVYGNNTLSIYQSANAPLTFWTNNTERMRISAAGGFSVGTTSDPGAGAIYATGNITAYFSDERLKTKTGNIENALDKVCQIETLLYHANETAVELGYDASIQEVGVTAQSVQKVQPEVVVPAPVDAKYLTVRYEKLVPLLIEAIKELKVEVDALKGK